MARLLTPEQLAVLRGASLKINILATFFLDEGTYRFCDDVVNLTHSGDTYIGANAVVGDIQIDSGADMAAESVTLVCDGMRMAQAGIEDPARVLRDMLGYLHLQRRVDLALGISSNDSTEISLRIPCYAGKISSVRLIDSAASVDKGFITADSALRIELDSLATRYTRASHRVRSHEDQLEIDPTDQFFSFVSSAVQSEQKIYWGKAAPYGSGGAVGGGGKYSFGEFGNVNFR